MYNIHVYNNVHVLYLKVQMLLYNVYVVSTATIEGGVTVVLSEVTGTETNVTGLTPGTYYTFSVTAENAVSPQDTNINDRTTTVTATTLEGGK